MYNMLLRSPLFKVEAASDIYHWLKLLRFIAILLRLSIGLICQK